jgi:hypothetical protein
MRKKRASVRAGNPEGSVKLPGRKRPVEPTGLDLVDGLAALSPVTLADYVRAVSEYVRRAPTLAVGPKKAAQLRLSYGLGQALVADLSGRLPQLAAKAGEHKVAGALRTVLADVSEYHELDGLRLAVEIKPVNLAVGRALWNRFGDIRAFAVNLHLKFPFAVVGGVLVIPTYEVSKKGAKKPTVQLIDRTIGRLVRAGRRQNESEASHLLEGIGIIVYDPDAGTLLNGLPPVGSGLRWDEFVGHMVEAYDARFGEGVGSSLIEAGEEDASEDVEGEDDDSNDGVKT